MSYSAAVISHDLSIRIILLYIHFLVPRIKKTVAKQQLHTKTNTNFSRCNFCFLVQTLLKSNMVPPISTQLASNTVRT